MCSSTVASFSPSRCLMPGSTPRAFSVRSHAVLWNPEQTREGGVVIAREQGMRFVGYGAPGGYAYDPYWELVRVVQGAPR